MDGSRSTDVQHIVAKLDHPNVEVRCRALDNLRSKLQYGIVNAMELACDRALIKKLFVWFNLSQCTKEKECLRIILTLSQMEYGRSTMLQLGAVNFLQSLKNDVPPECHVTISEILEQLFLIGISDSDKSYNHQTFASVSAAPSLSYQPSSEQEFSPRDTKLLSNQRYGNSRSLPSTDASIPSSEQSSRPSFENPSWYADVSSQSGYDACSLLFIEFPWIRLSTTDVHVLRSTNQSLLSQDDTLIESACEFLLDVMLYDFPAEIFVQRPAMVKSLVHLFSTLTPGSVYTRSEQKDNSRISRAGLVINTLTRISQALLSRVSFHSDPATFTVTPIEELSSNQEDESTASRKSVSIQLTPGASTPIHSVSGSSTSTSSQNGDSLSNDDTEERNVQLTLPEYADLVHGAAVDALDKVSPNERLGLARLIGHTHELFELSISQSVWRDMSVFCQGLCTRLRGQMCSLARHAMRQYDLALTEPRLDLSNARDVSGASVLYTQLALMSVRLYQWLVPVNAASTILGATEKQLLYVLVCDEVMRNMTPDLHTVAKTYSLAVEPHRGATLDASGIICDSMSKYFSFMVGCDSMIELLQGCTDPGKEVQLKVMNLVDDCDKAVYSMPYHMCTDIVGKLINLVSLFYPFVMDSDRMSDHLVSVTLKYIGHPISLVKVEAYKHLLAFLKDKLDFNKLPASNETVNAGKAILFMTHPFLMTEIATYGLPSEMPEIQKSSQQFFSYLIQSRLLVDQSVWKTVCQVITNVLPIIQSYSSLDTVLGKCILALIDPLYDSNFPRKSCLAAAVRVLFCRDPNARAHSAKMLMMEMNNMYSRHLVYPVTDARLYGDRMVSVSVRGPTAADRQAPLVGSDTITRILRVYNADHVEVSVRLTSLEQLSMLLADSRIHSNFLSEHSGLTFITSILQRGLHPEASADDREELPAVLNILLSLVENVIGIRETLVGNEEMILLLVRAAWEHPSSTQACGDAARILAYLLFHEVSSQRADTPDQTNNFLFMLPKTVCVRYKLPMTVLAQSDLSPHRVTVPSPSDPLLDPLPHRLLRTHWNIRYHSTLENLLEAELDSIHAERLVLTSNELAAMREKVPQHAIIKCLGAIVNASSHSAVLQQVNKLDNLILITELCGDRQTLKSIAWHSRFKRYLGLMPRSAADVNMLAAILSLFNSLYKAMCVDVSARETLLEQLHTVFSRQDSPLLELLQYNQEPEQDRQLQTSQRSVQSELLTLISSITSHYPTILTESQDLNASHDAVRPQGHMIERMLNRLTLADTTNFYNLSSLQSCVASLMFATSKQGWSLGAVDIDRRSLCSQLNTALFQVLSAFHLGRQGNSLSFMGRGVLLSATACLRNTASELLAIHPEIARIIVGEGDHEGRQLDWVLSLCSHRDQQVRASSLCLLSALVSMKRVNHEMSDIIMEKSIALCLHSTECSLVRQQACLLVSELILSLPHSAQKAAVDKLIKSSWCQATVSALDVNEGELYLSANLPADLSSLVMSDTFRLSTPGLLVSMLECLVLMCSIDPEATVKELKTCDLVPCLTSLVSDGVLKPIFTFTEPGICQVRLTFEVKSMLIQATSLLRCCVVTNEQQRFATCRSDGLLLGLFDTMLAAPDRSMARELLELISSILYLEKDNGFQAIRESLIKYREPLKDALVVSLIAVDDGTVICALELITLLGLRLAEVSDDQLIELLDGSGITLCKSILPIYDRLLMQYNQPESAQVRLAVIVSLKILISVSSNAQTFAHSEGLMESLLCHINAFHQKLNLLSSTLPSVGQRDLSPRDNLREIAVAEMVASLELLINLLNENREIKMSACQAGLPNLIHRLWMYGQTDRQLLNTILSLLASLTFDCPAAARYLVSTSPVSALEVGSSSETSQADKMTPNSLAHLLVRFCIGQLSLEAGGQIGLIRQLMEIMCHFTAAMETLSVICKSNIMEYYNLHNPRYIKRKRKLQASLSRIWLRFIYCMSLSTDGQRALLYSSRSKNNSTETVQLLVDEIKRSDDPQINSLVLTILYNISIQNSSTILSQDSVTLTIIDHLEYQLAEMSGYDTSAVVASATLHSLAYGSMKGRAQLKKLCIPERLSEILSNNKLATKDPSVIVLRKSLKLLKD